MRALLLCMRQAHQRKRGLGTRLELFLGLASVEHPLHSEIHILEASQPRQQRIVLALRRVERLASHPARTTSISQFFMRGHLAVLYIERRAVQKCHLRK